MTRRLSETAVAVIPQFFATAQLSMLADDGWRFSELGQFAERAITTANATRSITQSIVRRLESLHSIEIELSAFSVLVHGTYRHISALAEPSSFGFRGKALKCRDRSNLLRRCAEILQATLRAVPPRRKSTNVSRRIAQNTQRLDWYVL